MVYKVKMTGYHGTTYENAEKILSDQHFIESHRDNEWLGSGAYFFAYKAHADWWRTHSRYKGRRTEILSADLEYTEIQLLDLDDPEQMQQMERIVKEFSQLDGDTHVRAANLSMEERSHQLCWACNLMKELVPEIGIVIYTFYPFQRRKISKYTSLEGNQRQICVSNQSIIKSIKKVEGENDAG